MVMATEVCEGLEMKHFQNPVTISKHLLEGEEETPDFDQHSNTPIDWCTAVLVFKTLLRQNQILPATDEGLVPSSTETEREPAAPSTESKKNLESSVPENLLQHILKHLQLFESSDVKDATFTGLAFTSSQLEHKDNSDYLDTLASQLLSRLFQTCDVINKHIRAHQVYVNMTSSPTSHHLKPARVAPPIPKQARSLPPPPIPEHASDGSIVTSSPPVPIRTKSLVCSVFDPNDSFMSLSDSSVFVCSSEEELSDGEPSPSNPIISKTISHVVCRRLFNAECSPEDSWVERTAASLLRRSHDNGLICGSNVNSAKERNSTDRELIIQPAVSSSSATIVTTPDSGCGTAEDDSTHLISSNENRETVFIPKLNLESAIEEDPTYDIMETVPPLDLSEISPPDEDTRESNPSRREMLFAYNKPRRRRRSAKSSPNQIKSPPKPSSPIDIPIIHLPDMHDTDGDVTDDVSPSDGSLRWRDAWSTGDDIIPMQTAMENLVKRDVRYSIEDDEFELAPSSPENHLPLRHPQHHHHHKRHHHHDNHLSRPKLSNSLRKEEVRNYDHVFASLREILDALDEHRRENARPEDLTLMTREQIRSEKASMQRELLKHENRYGRPSTKEEKEIMRNVYERYRTVKRLLADAMSPPFSSALRRFDNFEYEINTSPHSDDFAVTQLVTLAPLDGKRRLPEYRIEANDHVSGDVGITELRKQHKEAKGKRKRLRRKLQEFEKEFEQQYGRAVNQTDRIIMAEEYKEYHGLKLKLRLLDALIQKHYSQYR